MAAIYGGVTITTAATNILPSDPARRGFLLANNGSNIVYIGLDASVTASNGIQIMPQDKFDLTGEHSVFKGAVWGITSSGTSDVRYWEWTP